MSQFTITISPFRAPFMRERMTKLQTVCKYRNGYKYEYSEYAYGKPRCGRVYRHEDNDETRAEKDSENIRPRYDRRYHMLYGDPPE